MSYWKEEANRRREIRQSVPCEDTTPYCKQRKSASKPFYLEKKLKRGEKSWSSTNEHEWHPAWGRYKTLKAAEEACRTLNKKSNPYYRQFHYRVASECMAVLGED